MSCCGMLYFYPPLRSRTSRSFGVRRIPAETIDFLSPPPLRSPKLATTAESQCGTECHWDVKPNHAVSEDAPSPTSSHQAKSCERVTLQLSLGANPPFKTPECSSEARRC